MFKYVAFKGPPRTIVICKYLLSNEPQTAIVMCKYFGFKGVPTATLNVCTLLSKRPPRETATML